MTGMENSNNHDFNLKLTKGQTKRPISITISQESQQLLDYLSQEFATNLSKYIDSLIRSAFKQQSIEPLYYPYEAGKYRECRILLRSEVADFLETWKNYGVCANLCVNGQPVPPSTPLEIARKISFVLANDVEVKVCDSEIYGFRDEIIESTFKRLADKVEQTKNPNIE